MRREQKREKMSVFEYDRVNVSWKLAGIIFLWENYNNICDINSSRKEPILVQNNQVCESNAPLPLSTPKPTDGGIWYPYMSMWWHLVSLYEFVVAFGQYPWVRGGIWYPYMTTWWHLVSLYKYEAKCLVHWQNQLH